jgi:hypothetical protein
MDVCLVSVVCCQVEVSATGWSLVQRSPTECGVSKKVWSWSLEKWGSLGPQGTVVPLGGGGEGFNSSGTWRRGSGRVVPNILKNHSALTALRKRWMHYNPSKCEDLLTKQQCNVPENLNIQQHYCEKLRSCILLCVSKYKTYSLLRDHRRS